MTPIITATYGAVLALIYVGMTAYVIRARVIADINLGDGGDPQMLLAIRRHGNMAEYVPFALLLMGFAEVLGLASMWLHVAGLALVAGRLLHPLGMHIAEGNIAPRVAGTLSTLAAILIPTGGIFLTTLA